MKQWTFVVVCLLWESLSGFAQNQPWPLQLTAFNNATLLPGMGKVGVFGVPVHPGFSAGTERRWNHHPKNQWFQTARVATHHHQFVQTSVQLYSEIGYRRLFGSWFDAELRLGPGYFHMFPGAPVYEPDGSGSFDRRYRLGRPQFMLTSALGLGFKVAGTPEAPWRVLLAYQFYMQTPFSPGYIPFLPNTALHVGLSFPCFTKTF
jgi:hypothetical protein